ncbi:hypothetical protein KCU77_g24078, partial [Aureobasidium melanogenum]
DTHLITLSLLRPGLFPGAERYHRVYLRACHRDRQAECFGRHILCYTFLERTYNDIYINIINIVHTHFNFFVHIININIALSYFYSSSCRDEQPFLYCCRH